MSVTSPPSLSKIIAEFGGPHNLGAYVRGGAYVPNVAANASISTTSNGLAISQFVGATAYTPLTLSLPATATTYGHAGKPIYMLNQAVGATVSGGSGTRSYSWTHVSGSTFTVSNGSTDTATFGCSSGPISTPFTRSGVYRCTVTDGTSSASDTVTVTFEFD